MNIKNNKKSQNSIKKIQTSLCGLLKSFGHKAITIKKVCEHASINRTTFYAHFNSIEDALYQTCEEYILCAYKIFLDTKLDYKSRVMKSLDIVKDKLEFFAYAFAHVHNLDQRIIEMVENYYCNNCKEFQKTQLSMSFIISGFIGICKKYFINNKFHNKIDLTGFADIICNTLNLQNPYLPM